MNFVTSLTLSYSPRSEEMSDRVRAMALFSLSKSWIQELSPPGFPPDEQGQV
jgi:hypothetical protein